MSGFKSLLRYQQFPFQALAVVFASPRLLQVPCRTVEQMRLVNALAAVKDYEFRSSGPVNDVI
ncbi:MAG: hypothetical protein WAO08_01540 [Hyphomicrobiaceae bacterium]